MSDPAESLATVLAYHERTKHHPGRFARSLGHMDWATQPDPFRRFAGAPVLSLDLVRFDDQPRYEPAFLLGNVPPVPLGRRWVSQLFQDSLALSAWKQAGAARWSLRVNPSSGNLHPTEGYLIADKIAAADVPVVTGPLITARSKVELRNRTMANPGLLAAAGVTISIATDHPVVPVHLLIV